MLGICNQCLHRGLKPNNLLLPLGEGWDEGFKIKRYTTFLAGNKIFRGFLIFSYFIISCLNMASRFLLVCWEYCWVWSSMGALWAATGRGAGAT